MMPASGVRVGERCRYVQVWQATRRHLAAPHRASSLRSRLRRLGFFSGALPLLFPRWLCFLLAFASLLGYARQALWMLQAFLGSFGI